MDMISKPERIVQKAELMLDEMLSLQEEYLPRFEPGLDRAARCWPEGM